jgi:hypothetical protein
MMLLLSILKFLSHRWRRAVGFFVFLEKRLFMSVTFHLATSTQGCPLYSVYVLIVLVIVESFSCIDWAALFGFFKYGSRRVLVVNTEEKMFGLRLQLANRRLKRFPREQAR